MVRHTSIILINVMQTGLQKIEDNNGETQVYCYDVDGKKIFGEYKCILS